MSSTLVLYPTQTSLALQIASGTPGTDAEVEVGTVTTLAPGAPATVTNSGTPGNAVFDFGIPQGEPGDDGITSVAVGNLSPLFTASVANPTTAPDVTFSLSNAAANTYLGNATGSPAAPSYTAAGALTKTDDTNVTLTLGGAPTTALLTAASITAGWTGTLSGARGGTGVANTGKTITVSGNTTIGSGTDTVAFATTGATSVTLPTSGTLATTSYVPTAVTVANEATDTTCFMGFFTAATGDLGPKTNTNVTFNSNTGVLTSASSVLTTTDINGGTIDGTVIGGSSAAAITGTTVTANTSVTTPTVNNTAGVDIQGTNTNDSAASGYVGEYITATLAQGSAISLTTATAANVTSISLTAGDWDVNGVVAIVSSGVTPSDFRAAVSSTSATLPTNGVMGNVAYINMMNSGAAGFLSTGPARFSLSGTTTIYLVARATFSAGSATAYGSISARRMR